MTWFIEILFRGLITLAQASWRRTPPSQFKVLKWLRFYLPWTGIFVICALIFPYRASLFIAIYAWFRPVDDIIDGEDTQQPKSLGDFICNTNKNLIYLLDYEVSIRRIKGRDRLLIYISDLSAKLKIHEACREKLYTVWDCMLTDFFWRKSETIPSQAQLDKYACDQDVAIFHLLALIFGVPEKALQGFDFEKTGVFTKTDWITDLQHDLASGLIHIPKEECNHHGLTFNCLRSENQERQKYLENFIPKSLTELLPLWEKLRDQKDRFLSFVPNIWLKHVYDHCLIKAFERHMARECRKYGIPFPLSK